MLTYFPKYFSTRAIACYFVTLLVTSVVFFSRPLPFQFMLFGMVAVCSFFAFAHKNTVEWQRLPPRVFAKRLFYTALAIRATYVVFIYFYYIEMTGAPFMFHSGDESFYHYMGTIWREHGFLAMRSAVKETVGLSDSGYCWWLGLEYLLLGTHVLPARLVKCALDATSCVLVYNLAKRNFGETTARIAAVFYMLMPNMWYYCGITLKETDMNFLVHLFVERADKMIRSPKIKLWDVLLPVLCILAAFTMRTPLALVMAFSLMIAMVFASARQFQTWKKIALGLFFTVWLFSTVGVEIVQETQSLWEQRLDNQSIGYEARSTREHGNVFANRISGVVAAPAIFTIPFSSMVYVEGQENQMMMHGANFIKNVTSGLTLFALVLLIVSGEWRKHVLPLALMGGYLVVIAFSNFAHSERFHFPALALELMFAAYGLSQVQDKHKRWFVIWLVVVCLANVGWAWFKLAGRGLA